MTKSSGNEPHGVMVDEKFPKRQNNQAVLECIFCKCNNNIFTIKWEHHNYDRNTWLVECSVCHRTWR